MQMLKEQEFDLTELSKRLYIAGQCWRNRTEVLGERNNIIGLSNYLSKSFNDSYFIIRFGIKEEESPFRNELILMQPEFDISYVINAARIVKGWFSLDPANVCIIEFKGNLNKFLFLVSCILRVNGIKKSCQESLDHIKYLRYKHKTVQNNTLTRYINYVEKIFTDNENVFSFPYRLKQIIIAKTERIAKDFGKTYFRIYVEGEKVPNETLKFLIDENYIIAEFRELFIKGNIKIEVFHKTNLGNHPIFELYFNTCFMSEGLFRYDFSDIITPLGDNLTSKRLRDNFFADIVLYSSDLNERKTYSTDISIPLCLRLLSQSLTRKINEFEFHKLISDGYNKIYSKIFLQLGFTKEETACKINEINIRDLGMVKNSLSMKNNIPNKIVFENVERNKSLNSIPDNNELNMNIKPFESRKYLESNNNENILIEDIEMIPEKVLFNTKKQSPASMPFFKKKINQSVQKLIEEEKTVVAKRPLHLQVINNTSQTLYNDLESYKIYFDKTKFEEWFCEPIAKEMVKKIIQKKNVINDEQRIFLISISLKTLEKKGYDIKNLNNIVVERPFLFKYEDLQNILRILPKEGEIEKLNEACNKLESVNLRSELNEIEYFLYQNRDCQNLRKILNILLFERRSFEDLDDIDDMLDKIKRIYYMIIESNRLRLLLKVIIDISNMINYRYSISKFKRRTKGFKFLSLKNVMSYKGIRDENRLMTFISLTLLKEKPEIFDIFIEFKDLKLIFKEDLAVLKDRINRVVFEYNEAKKCFTGLDPDGNIKTQLGKFMSFVCKKLKGIIDKYKEIIYIGAIIKRKLGEDDNTNINDILRTLDDFLGSLEYEYKMQQA